MGQIFAVFIVVVGIAEVAACIRHIQNGYLPKWAPRRVITDPKWRQKQLSCDLVKKRVEDLEENNEDPTSFQQQQQQKQLEGSQNNSLIFEDGYFPRQQEEEAEKRINEAFITDNIELDDVRPSDAKIKLGDDSIENESNNKSIDKQLVQNENIQCTDCMANIQNQMVCSEVKDILKDSSVPLNFMEHSSPEVTEIQQVIEVVNYSSQGPVECPSLNESVPFISQSNSTTVSKIQECSISPELQVQNHQDSVTSSNFDQFIAIIDSISEEPTLISDIKGHECQATEFSNQKDKRPVECSDTNQTAPVNDCITEQNYSVPGIKVQEYEPSIEIKSQSVSELVVECSTVSTAPVIESIDETKIISEKVQEPSIQSQNTSELVEYSNTTTAPVVEAVEETKITPEKVQSNEILVQSQSIPELIVECSTVSTAPAIESDVIPEKVQEPSTKSQNTPELVECYIATSAPAVEFAKQPEIIIDKIQDPSLNITSNPELLECSNAPAVESIEQHGLSAEKVQEYDPSIRSENASEPVTCSAPIMESVDDHEPQVQVSDAQQVQTLAELPNVQVITASVKLEPEAILSQCEIIPKEPLITNGHVTPDTVVHNQNLTHESDTSIQQAAHEIKEDVENTNTVSDLPLRVEEIAKNENKNIISELSERVVGDVPLSSSSEGTEINQKKIEIIEPEINSTEFVHPEVCTEQTLETVPETKTADAEYRITKDTNIPKTDIRRTSEIFYAGDADLYYLQQLCDGSLEPKPSIDEIKPPEVTVAHKVEPCNANIDEDIQNANKSELILDDKLDDEACSVETASADVQPPVDVNGNTEESRLEPELAAAGDGGELMTVTPSSDEAEQQVVAAPPRESLISVPHDGSTSSRKEKIINLLSGILTNAPVQNDEVQPSKKVDYENAKEVSETVQHITETTQETTETKTEYTGEDIRKLTKSPNIFTKSHDNVELKNKNSNEDINTAIIKPQPFIPRSQSQDNFEIQENKIEISEAHFEPQVSIPFESCDSPGIIPDESRLQVESRPPPQALATPPPSPVNEESTPDTDQATTLGPSTSKSPSTKDSEVNESDPQRVTIPREMKNTLWLIFSGEYTKAMSKDWHSGHFCCWQCDESLTGQRYVLRDDHPYCIKCYESVFANSCEECNKTIGIDSKDLSYKDKHWHEVCFLCTKCRVSLVDKQFGSKADKIYCGNCYDSQFASRCDGCGEIFRAGTKKMEYKTRQWHEKCFCCCVCKSAIGTKSFIPREQEIYCATCYEEKFATRCVKCNKIITTGGVTYKNEPWHRECFTCTNCNASLAGQRFTSRDEKPYCAECFGELFAKRCTSCSKPITGIGGTRFISFEDRHWHNDCFICATCKTSLVGRGFITDADDIICPECAKQKLM